VNNIALELLTLEDLIKLFPTVVLVLMVTAAGFFAAWFLASKHIVSLKEFIEYLKSLK